MKKIFMLCFANIKKAKGNSVSLLIMFLISAFLFNAGLLVLINFSGFFDKTTDELNTSDTYYLISNSLYSQELEDYILNHENLEQMEKEENLWGNGKTTFNGNLIDTFFVFNNVEVQRDLSKWKFIGEHLPLEGMSIYLPISFKLNSGYEINDTFKLELKEKTLSFIVKGFVEDIFFNSQDTGFPGVYVSSETYDIVLDTLGNDSKVIKLFVNLKKLNKDIEIGIKQMTGAETLTTSIELTKGMFSIDKGINKMARTMMASMIALMFVVFSTIISIVCLIVVRFKIGNTIEDDMTKIGALKAMGYTSKQIISSIILQFVLIAIVGIVLGIGVSYLSIPTLSDVFAKQSAIIWIQGFDLTISLITIILIIFIVVLVSLIAARRIRKLNPIVALRGGIVTHNFRKNHLPLDKAKGNLPFILAIKSTFNNLKQSIMILIISIAISFASAFAFVMFYNTNVDIKAFEETPGIEVSNVVAVLKDDVDNIKFANEVKSLTGVRKVQYIDSSNVYISGIEVTTFIMEDYKNKETITIYEGRYPIHSNEIAINGYLAEMLGKNIEDIVEIKHGNNIEKYIITGFTQGAQMGGMNASITYDGILKLIPQFELKSLQIYLNKGINAATFIKSLENLYSDQTMMIIDMDKNMEIGTKAYVDIVSKAGIAMLIFTVVLIILVLYFVINSSVVRNKRLLGIQKALGFTTFQLMNQISLMFIFPVTIGVVIGSKLGIELSNPIMTLSQKSMGMMKTNYIVTPLWISLCGLIIIVISYISSLAITYKIRKISTYALISE